MLGRYVLLAVSFVLAILVVIVSFANSQPAPLNFLASQISLPLALPLLTTFAVGALCGFSSAWQGRGKAKGEAKRLEWHAQDAKLAAEVKSDREKQLEAKIQTLETALKQALKKA